MPYNKIKYNSEYNKTHYTEKKVRLKPDLARVIAIYCEQNSISFNDLMARSVKNYIETKTGVKLDI